MFTQSQIEILASLDAYFAETPQSIIESDVEAVSLLEFAGSTAQDYFNLFSQYFNFDLFETPNENLTNASNFVEPDYISTTKMQATKHLKLLD